MAKTCYNNRMFEHSGDGRRQRPNFRLWTTDVYPVDNYLNRAKITFLKLSTGCSQCGIKTTRKVIHRVIHIEKTVNKGINPHPLDAIYGLESSLSQSETNPHSPSGNAVNR